VTRPGTSPPPLLGVAGSWGAAELELYRRFDDLHQLIYVRGGIRPSNAAVEEVAKLILIRLWRLRHSGQTELDDRAAFAAALHEPALHAIDPAGQSHPIWPVDEPFRLTDDSVLRAAADLVETILPAGRPTVSDPLGTAFDALLAGRYDHAGGLGTYLTPSGVARSMAEIALDLLDPAVLATRVGFGDPYCGTGRFLVALLEVLRDRAEHPPAAALLAAGPFGADQSAASVAKARINMLLYGVDRPLVWTVRDSATDSDVDRLKGTVPLVLTNPPFGERKYDDPAGLAATAAAIPRLAGRRRIDPSLAGLVRALTLVAPGGVLGIVLPDGVVSSAAFADLALRDGAPGISVAACVSLPSTTFALSGTVAKTSAVFLRRALRTDPAARPARVALVRVRHVGFLRQGGHAAPDPAGDDLPALAGLIRRSLTADSATDRPPADPPVPGNGLTVRLVDPESLHRLDPSGLDPTALAARSWLALRGGVELRELLALAGAPRAATVTSPFVSVLHVDELGGIDWPAARAHTPTTPGLLVAPGELIVSLLNPSRLRVAVIPADTASVQVSAEFGVFRALVDPYAVLGLLQTPRVRAQLSPLGTGTSSSRRRIGTDDVLSVVVPRLDPAELDRLGRAVRIAAAQVSDGRERLHRLFARVD
jgi:predicted RNA methylase